MDVKYVYVFLVVFFLTISAVSAAENVTNEDFMLSVAEDNGDLAVSNNLSLSGGDGDCLAVSSGADSLNATSEEILSVSNNVSLFGGDGDCLAVSSGADSLNATSEEILSVSNNVSLSGGDGDCLAVSENVGSLASVNELPVALSVESQLSASNNQPKLSMQVNQEDSKLTSIYDKVYSTKQWRTVGLFSIKYKYSWSKKKINQVTKKKIKSNKKKAKKIMKKYLKKGWTYSRVYYTWKYGKTAVKYWYYYQFYRTVYYNGYGKVLYVC